MEFGRREIAVLSLVVGGLTDDQIARRLRLTARTVKGDLATWVATKAGLLDLLLVHFVAANPTTVGEARRVLAQNRMHHLTEHEHGQLQRAVEVGVRPHASVADIARDFKISVPVLGERHTQFARAMRMPVRLRGPLVMTEYRIASEV